MALSKIQAESMNLADTYAFSGTVSGTPNGLVLLQTVTADDDTTVEIGSASLFTSAYRTYIIYFSNVHNASDNTSLNMRLGIGGSIKTDSNYDYSRHYQYSGGSTVSTSFGNNATSFIRAFGQSNGNDTGEQSSGFVMIYDPSSTDNYKHIRVEASNDDLSSNSALQTLSGRYESGTAACTSVQMYAFNGNITSGYFRLYGVA